MGDFNAKIGFGNEKCLGKFSYAIRNERGKDLVNFAVSKNLKICNTLFQKTPSRKWTSRSPNHQTFNEIDYILKKNPDMITNSEVLNCVKGSDHRMVRITIKLSVKFDVLRGQLQGNQNDFHWQLRCQINHLPCSRKATRVLKCTELDSPVSSF